MLSRSRKRPTSWHYEGTNQCLKKIWSKEGAIYIYHPGVEHFFLFFVISSWCFVIFILVLVCRLSDSWFCVPRKQCVQYNSILKHNASSLENNLSQMVNAWEYQIARLRISDDDRLPPVQQKTSTKNKSDTQKSPRKFLTRNRPCINIATTYKISAEVCFSVYIDMASETAIRRAGHQRLRVPPRDILS